MVWSMSEAFCQSSRKGAKIAGLVPTAQGLMASAVVKLPIWLLDLRKAPPQGVHAILHEAPPKGLIEFGS